MSTLENFYVSVNLSNLSICAISAEKPEWKENEACIEVDHELGISFLTGEESTNDWYAYKKEDKYLLSKIDKTKFVNCRIDIAGFQQVIEGSESSDITLTKSETGLLIKSDFVKLKQKLNTCGPIVLYITQQNDLSDLITSFEISDESLYKIFNSYNEYEWVDIQLNIKHTYFDVFFSNKHYTCNFI